MITIRKATSQDIDEFKSVIIASILELCKDCYTQKEIKSLLAQYPDRELYEKWILERVLVIAAHENNIVGFAQYYPPNNSIEAVHVLPNYAKQGVGKKMIEKIEEIAKAQKAGKIILGSSLNAVGFYEKCGYTRKDNSKFKCNDGVLLEVVNYEKELCS